MSYGGFDAIRDELRSDLSYQVAAAKIDFATQLHEHMQANGITKSGLADAIRKSPPWVTKVLSGDCNFTIETMVQLANAVHGELRLQIESSSARKSVADIDWLRQLKATTRQSPRLRGVGTHAHVFNFIADERASSNDDGYHIASAFQMA